MVEEKNISPRGEVKIQPLWKHQRPVVKWLDWRHTASPWENWKHSNCFPTQPQDVNMTAPASANRPPEQGESLLQGSLPPAGLPPSCRAPSFLQIQDWWSSAVRAANWKLMGLDSTGKFGESFTFVLFLHMQNKATRLKPTLCPAGRKEVEN